MSNPCNFKTAFYAGLSFLQISRCADASTGAIQKMRNRLAATSVSRLLSEAQLSCLLYPESDSQPGDLDAPDWADVI